MSEVNGREWFIQNPQYEICTATKVSAFDAEVNPQVIEEVHVIEYSAFEKLQAENERLRAALEFYAGGEIVRCIDGYDQNQNEIWGEIWCPNNDRGKKARQALRGEG